MSGKGEPLSVLERILSEQKPERPPEAPLEPDLPIIDPHHHLRDRPGHLYMLPELLRDIMRGHNITATVVVECSAMFRASGPEEMRCVGETEFCNGIAAMSASGAYGPTHVCAGIVGFVDMRLAERVRPVLEAHIAAGGGRFRGIRNQVTWDEDEELTNERGLNVAHALLDPALRRGVACLAEYDLVFDTHMLFTQLGEVYELAKAVPRTTIVVNHMGGPAHIGRFTGRREEVFVQWRDGMKKVAQLPNVVVKVGGLGMDTLGYDFHKQSVRPSSETLAPLWRPYIETCVELFGPQRSMFESNFPPDKKSCDYGILWNAIKRVAAQYTPAEKAALFSGAAKAAYRL